MHGLLCLILYKENVHRWDYAAKQSNEKKRLKQLFPASRQGAATGIAEWGAAPHPLSCN